KSLAEFADHDNLTDLLDAALGALVARVRVREAMIEVVDDGLGEMPRVAAYGCDGDRLTAISSFVSRGIIGQAIATGTMIVTANAAQDPRFLAFESVQAHQLEAVLCVPIGHAMHCGVVYLQ